MTHKPIEPIDELQMLADETGPLGSTLSPTTQYKEFCRDCGLPLGDDDQNVRCAPCDALEMEADRAKDQDRERGVQ
jgi:hypothetical protein